MSKKKPKSADLHPGPGFRIKTGMQRPSPELVTRYAAYETPDISDLMNRLYAMDGGISNLINSENIAGPALTVKLFPGDNLMIHKALDVAQPGDVVIVDTSLNTTTAVIGDLVTQKAKHRGIKGFIIDGLVRDLPAMKGVDLPVFARGVTPIGPLHRGPGELGYVVSCGGIVIRPGDLIVADGNGIVAVRADFAADILARLDAQRDGMAAYLQSVRDGSFSNEWVNAALLDCPVSE